MLLNYTIGVIERFQLLDIANPKIFCTHPDEITWLLIFSNHMGKILPVAADFNSFYFLFSTFIVDRLSNFSWLAMRIKAKG